MIVLCGFTRNWYNDIGVLCFENITCRIWFSNQDEVLDFVKSKQAVPWAKSPHGLKTKSKRWNDYFTSDLTYGK
jgi:hypothetical protein